MIKKILILILLSFLIVSCGSDSYPEIRVFNNSDSKIENVSVADVNFGSIEVAAHSDYKEFDIHYDVLKIKYTYKGEEYTYEGFKDENLMDEKYCVQITKKTNETGHMFALESVIKCSDSK